MTAEAVGLFLDYSKNRVTAKTLKLLLRMADESGLREQIAAMFRGEKINITEKRAVLHVALRAPRGASIIVDGRNVVPDVHAVLDKMADFSIGNPNRQPSPLRNLHQRLDNRLLTGLKRVDMSRFRPVGPVGAEDAVHAAREVDGGGGASRRGGDPPDTRRRIGRGSATPSSPGGAGQAHARARSAAPAARPAAAPARAARSTAPSASPPPAPPLRPARRVRCSRRSLTSLPVSIPTGQASWQVPSAAQVWIAVVLVLARAAPRSTGEPAGWRAISRRITIRWRGVVVRLRLGQTGSQKPHSTQVVGDLLDLPASS